MKKQITLNWDNLEIYFKHTIKSDFLDEYMKLVKSAKEKPEELFITLSETMWDMDKNETMKMVINPITTFNGGILVGLALAQMSDTEKFKDVTKTMKNYLGNVVSFPQKGA